MKQTSNGNLKRKSLLAAGLALTLAFSVGVLAGCDTDTNATTTKTDTCAIANGNFEYYTDDDNLKLIVSPNSWTKSVGTDNNGDSASSSTKASGIVNTESKNWTSLTTSSVDEEEKVIEIEYDGEIPNVAKALKDGKAKWDTMSVFDRLTFYKDLGEAINKYNDEKDTDKYSLSDFYYYDDNVYEISLSDVPDCANPGTKDGYYTKNDDGTYDLYAALGDETPVRTGIAAAEAESSVLMIHNYRSDNLGTAQKYTSSTTITLAANTSARLSVWVKTQDMTYGGTSSEKGPAVNGSRGASINITHTVGGKTLDQMKIKNIDTKDVADNNGWAQYTVYVKACSYATSTFTVVLGLGEGSSKLADGYVAGYAFFDDVDMDIISNEDFDDAVKNSADEYVVPVCTLDSTAKQKQFRTDEFNYTALYPDAQKENTYALDLYADLQPFALSGADKAVDVSADLTTVKVNGIEYTTVNYKGLGISTDGDITQLTTLSALKNVSNNAYLDAVLEKSFENYPFDDDDDMIFLLSAHGAAYTAKMEQTSDFFTLDEDEYLLISFFVKTSDTTGFTGATATLKDCANKSSIGPYNTKDMSTVDLDDRKDIYDGWVQCFFFVQNETEESHDFYLEFSYGPTDLTDTKKTDFTEGFAAFTGFTFTRLTASEYASYAGSAPQSTSVSLLGENTSTLTSDGFSAVVATQTEQLKKNLADPQKYTGVKGNDVKVFGTEDFKETNQSKADNATKESAKSVGMINSNYFANYIENARTATDHSYDWLKLVLGTKSLNLTDTLNATEVWNNIFGTATQPLLIANVVEQSYGCFTATSNLSSNGYSAISLRVMASRGAKAYIYLIDTSDVWSETYGEVSQIDTVSTTYWYDDDGNVCLSDPTDKDTFNARTDTAFYKSTENGLYGNNLDATDKNVYANLANYDKDDDGNLIVRTNSSDQPIISYNYFEDYKDDGIAFYQKDGKYYAYYDADKDTYSTEVVDFSACPQYVEGKANFTTKYARYLSKSYLEEKGLTASDLGENVVITGLVDTRACIVVDGDDPNVAGKWITVKFLVATGNESFSYRLEVFSGSRDGLVKSAEGSFVAFNVCTTADISSNYEKLLKNKLEDMTSGSYRSPSVDFATGTKTYATADLLQNEDTDRLEYADGTQYENAEYFCYSFYDDTAYQRYDRSLDELGDGDLYTGYSASAQQETMTYLYYETENTSAQAGSAAPSEDVEYTMFINYSPLYQNVEKDDAVANETEDEEEPWYENSDFWLMLSSIVLSVVLLLVLVIVFITKLARNARKSSARENRYNAKRKHYIRKLNLTEEPEATEESEAPAAEENPSEENPYED